MSYYCFVQARYSSSRLRGKVLNKFGELTLIEIIVERLKKSKELDKIVILTSNSIHDKKIVNLCKKKNIDYFCGTLNNVFLRFKTAIKKYCPRRIVRISADSPLIDWRLVDKMIVLSKKHSDHDIITNIEKRTFPKGQSVEILKPEVFDISSNLLTNQQKEHVTKFFYEKKNYKIFNHKSKKKFDKYNLCVDRYSDYLFISKLIKKKGIFATWKSYVREI